MIGELIDSALEFLKNNQFASGGLVMGISAIAYQHGSKVIGWVKDLIWRRIFITVRLNRWTYGFEWVRSWLKDVLDDNQKLVYEYEINAQSEGNKSNIILDQSEGRWLVAPSGFRVFIKMHRIEEKTDLGTRIYNKMTLTTGQWNKKKLAKLMSSVGERYGLKKAGKIYVPNSDKTDWELWCDVPKASMDHVILKQDLKQRILFDIEEFLRSESRYRELGLSYKRGYLFYGPPGNGKTSLIRALAHHFGKSIAFVKGSQLALDNVQQLIARSGSDKLIVIEDIDRADVVNNNNQDSGVQATQNVVQILRTGTLQNILNLMDGVQGGNGQIIICTANNPEKLDAAFLRPGRIDCKFELGNATSEQIRGLFVKFFGQDYIALAETFAITISSSEYSMAQLQKHFLDHLDDPIAAFEHLNQLISYDQDLISTQSR